MGEVTLTTEEQEGVKTSIVVIMLVLVLFVLELLAGNPLMHFKTEPASVAYAVLVYTPVMAICVLAYRRLR
jgi:steroid 5-alpha reductase family enzyme